MRKIHASKSTFCKGIAISFIVFCMASASFAQWTRSVPSVRLQYNTDYVGIGIQTPIARLQVRDTTTTAGTKIIFLGNTMNTSCLPAFQLTDGTTTRTVLGLRTGDIAVDNNGKVGIGTPGPNYLLELNDANTSNQTQAAFLSTNGATGKRNQIIVGLQATGENSAVFGHQFVNGGGGDFAYLGTWGYENTLVCKTGAVGIGTTNPGANLEVNSGGADVSPVIAASTPNSVDFVSIFGGRQNNQNPYIAWARGSLRFATATAFGGGTFSEKMRIQSGGNIGINTTTPGRQLELSYSDANTSTFGNTTNGIVLRNSLTDVFGHESEILFATNVSSSYFAGVAGNYDAYTNQPGGSLRFGTRSGNNVNGTGILERMRITSEGLTGIGTPAPGYLLDVGSSTNRGLVRIAGSSSAAPSLILSDNQTNGRTYNLYSGNVAGAFSVYDATASQHRLIIASNGTVCIGTTNPGTSYKLVVEGKIGAREVLVTQATWADNVLKNDYKLKPLEKVAKYIQDNKHLEGIPTDAEVKKNGVSVGDMQAKLLQKVEELTLYTIAIKKENDELRAKMCELEKRIGK